ncbi:MAG: TRAM domain-containing protein [Buchananella hordeovulneris]|nr:TRAM domain-containing protein [Buchananella hordeovulneris]
MELLTLEIGPVAHGGHCVSHTPAGQLVFVRHTAPGESVRARVTKTGRYWQADAVEVLGASEHRVESAWPAAGPGGIGGAEFAHLSAPYQRQLKAEVITDCLRRTGSRALAEHVAATVGAVEVAALPTPAEQAGRTRVEAVVSKDGALAMHKHSSHDLIELDAMPLAVPQLAQLPVFGTASPWASRWQPGNRVRLVAPSASPVLVGIEGGFYGQDGQPANSTVTEVVSTPLGELTYQLEAGGFWQVQRGAPEALTATVLELAKVGEGQQVLELYSGAGLFSQALGRAVAGSGGKVVTVEGAKRAVAWARRNCADVPVQALAGAVDPGGIKRAAAKLGRPADVVVLDPPRVGARAAVMRAVCELSPQRIVLVACDPAALARDCELAAQEGYWPTDLRAWDLFPNTHHVESVALLQKVGG